MSISKAQAELLATDFLDQIGTAKDGLQPRRAVAEIFLLAGELIDSAQKNLIAANRIATGKLSESLVADEPDTIGKTIRIDVLMNFYGAFVNKGVAGTRGGRSTAGYSFKTELPSENMVSAIREWIDNAKITTRTVKKYSGYKKHEVRRKTIAEYDNAYAVARGIKMAGLKPTGFMDKAADKTREKVSSRLGAALRLDVIDGLSAL